MNTTGSTRAVRRLRQLAAHGGAPPVVALVSLGCAKNLVDSEVMLGRIAESGAVISGDEAAADTIVVNTCGFLEASRAEVFEVLGELVRRKRSGNLRRIVVAGCLVQRDGESLREQVPEIDALVGVNNRDDITTAVWGTRADPGEGTAVRRKRRADAPSAKATPRSADRYLGAYHPQPWTDRARLRLTPRHYAYVRISEGCDQKCTFCTIPSIRGPMHCKSPDDLAAECEELIADGAHELILIGQDTTSYGRDIGYEAGLAGLLRTLDQRCDGARWLRLMYAYPSAFTDEMIDAIAAGARIVKYIDLPLQHINDRVLRAMGRRVTRSKTEKLLEKIRARIPGVAIRTTFIVGFPGETEAEFDELLDFVRAFGFDAAGAFRYSHEPETPAARIAHAHDATEKQARYDRFMRVQQEVALATAQRWTGRKFEVVVDGPTPRGAWAARHAGQAPEVDAVCLLAGRRHAPGDVISVRCTGSDGYDLTVQPLRHTLHVSSPPN